MNKKTLCLVLLSGILVLAFVPQVVVLAQGAAAGAGAGGGGQSLQAIAQKVADNLTPLAGALATIAFIVSGIMFLTATGNPSNMSVAKASLLAGVIGIVVIVLAKGAEAFVKQLTGL